MSNELLPSGQGVSALWTEMLIKYTDTQKGQRHSLNWPPTFLWILLDYDFGSDTTLPHWHFMHKLLHWTGWETKQKLLMFPINLHLHCIIMRLIPIISITVDVAHLFWHCFFKFMVEQAFVHSALSHLGLQKKNIHKTLSRSTERYSTLHVHTYQMCTHQHIGPHLLHKAAMWSNPVILTQSTWGAAVNHVSPPPSWYWTSKVHTCSE